MTFKLSDLNLSERKKVLAYGLSGSGKTVFACSFPGPILFFDFDGKVSSAASFYKNSPQLNEIQVESCSSVDSFNIFWKKFMELKTLAQKPENFPYKTIVLDSITTFSMSLMAEVMRQNPGEASKRSRVADTLVPHLKDYQIAISHIKNTISGLLNLPCNIVMTAHLQTDKDELTGEIMRQPLIFGKDLPGWLPMVFEEVYYCSVTSGSDASGKSQIKHQGQARGPKYICRTQIPNLPALFDLSYENMKKHF
jgi:AAA domain